MAKARTRKKAPKKKGPKWEQTEYGIQKNWKSKDGERVQLTIFGRTLDKQRFEVPDAETKPKRSRSKKPKRDDSDIPF